MYEKIKYTKTGLEDRYNDFIAELNNIISTPQITEREKLLESYKRKLKSQIVMLIAESKKYPFEAQEYEKGIELLKGLETIIDSEFENLQTKSIRKTKSANEKIRLDLNKRQIAYLFDELLKIGVIRKQYNPNYLELISRYFTDVKGSDFTNSDLSLAKNGYENSKSGKPQNTKVVDDFIKKIKDIKSYDKDID